MIGLAGLVAAGLFFYFNRFPRHQELEFLTFNELKTLSQNPHPGFFLKRKLERFWRIPLISNEAYYHGAKPHRPRDPILGPYLGLVSWNIEKSIRMQDAVTAFSGSDTFRSLINPQKAPEDSPHYKNNEY